MLEKNGDRLNEIIKYIKNFHFKYLKMTVSHDFIALPCIISTHLLLLISCPPAARVYSVEFRYIYIYVPIYDVVLDEFDIKLLIQRFRYSLLLHNSLFGVGTYIL